MFNISETQQSQLFNLFIEVGGNYNRISIAENYLNDDFLMLYLEDKKNIKEHLDQCVIVELPLDDFAKFIKDGNYNKYQGRCLSQTERPFDGLIEIDEPIRWFENDATTFQVNCLLEDLVKAMVKSVIDNTAI